MTITKPTLKLTKNAIKQRKAPTESGKQELFWDAEHGKFGIVCSGVSRSKSWIVQSKFNGRTKRVTIGATELYDRDAAWEKGRPILYDIENGIDPKLERKRMAKGSITVEEVLQKYLAQPKLSTRTKTAYRNMADRYLNPWLKRPLRSITGDDVEDRFAAISKDIAQRQAAGLVKGGVNVRGAATANVVLQLFGALWNYQSKRDETLGKSPLSRLSGEWHKIRRRKRRLWDQDFPTFYQAVMALPTRAHKDLLLLGLHTGLRENELQGLKWAEVDFRYQVISLPAERVKNREDFELPMNSYVLALLEARREVGLEGGGVYVFPGTGKTRHTQSFSWALEQIGKDIGLKLSPHDLRRTFLSVAENAGVSEFAKKQLVGHTVERDVTDGYTVLAREDLRRVAQKVGDKIMALCTVAPQAANEGTASQQSA
jgi:integrase